MDGFYRPLAGAPDPQTDPIAAAVDRCWHDLTHGQLRNVKAIALTDLTTEDREIFRRHGLAWSWGEADDMHEFLQARLDMRHGGIVDRVMSRLSANIRDC